jgi:hypothetical protein
MKPINVQMERTEFFDDFLERLEQRRKNILAMKAVENIQKMVDKLITKNVYLIIECK